ncbi:hypothetical protein HanOQP8_Chr04g0148461 [Helianthus annuus]|nr:hypothetical protein HanOQP8_Chr04g0148461 [Helianthus annuus]
MVVLKGSCDFQMVMSVVADGSRSHAPGERRRLWWLGSALAWPVNRRSGLKRVRIVARINSVLVRA